MKKYQKEEIQRLIAKNSLEKAFQKFRNHINDEDKESEIIMLVRRFNDLKRNKRLGILPYSKITIENNQIVSNFLDLLNDVEITETSIIKETKKEEDQTRKEKIKTPPTQQKRLALVIGCSHYVHAGALRNPINDAVGMEQSLKKLGFDVIMKTDPNLKDMKMVIDDFGSRLGQYDVGLFYFAGHGVEVQGVNYLIPVDANLTSEKHVDYDCVRADRVLMNMENMNNKVNIIILDACRNNPFERSWGRGLKGRGLAVMDAPTGSIIGYSTSPGKTASDGSGQNGLYTGVLIKELVKDNSSITEMFQRVRKEVIHISNGDQTPWESTSLTDNFFLIGK